MEVTAILVYNTAYPHMRISNRMCCESICNEEKHIYNVAPMQYLVKCRNYVAFIHFHGITVNNLGYCIFILSP